jgi:hypothetical protein
VSDTPETDAYIGDQNEGLMTEGEFAMCEFARMVERDRNELRHKFETLERKNAAMREAIREASQALFNYCGARGDMLTSEQQTQAIAALTKLQPFLKP